LNVLKSYKVTSEVIAAVKHMKLALSECKASLREIVDAKKLQGSSSLNAMKDSIQEIDLLHSKIEMFKAKISICEKYKPMIFFFFFERKT